MASVWTTGLILSALLVGSAVQAAPQNLRDERQGTLEYLLTQASPEIVERARVHCLSGEQPSMIAQSRALGARALPDAADYCITVLIRSARDGNLTPLRRADATQATAASAIDNGFMVGYRKGEEVPSDLPNMVTLKPIAERCLMQREPHIGLCYSTGYAFGLRASHGELIAIP